jgi:hypothetical protein
MKGLDWIAVASNIAFDDDLEHHSDAAFRTYIELLGLSAFRLSDGFIETQDAIKRCNARHLNAALGELLNAGYVEKTESGIYLPKYSKWQRTRAEVEVERAKTVDRVRRFRGSNASGNGVSNGVSNGSGNTTRVEKSRVEKKEEGTRKRAATPDSAEPAQRWTARWVEAEQAAGREPSARDRGIFGNLVKTIPNLDDGVMEDTIAMMVAQSKQAQHLVYKYGDCLAAAEREIDRVNFGGGQRVR